MIDYSRLLEQLAETPLAPLAANLPSAIEKGLSIQRYGDLPDW